MATYTMLSNGSRGDEVKKLQTSLINAGYNVGSTGADGIYGSDTENAVRKYQQANGLDVDGIAGDQTLGKLYAAANNTGQVVNKPISEPVKSTSNAKQETPQKAPDYSVYSYDAASDAAYQQALAALQEAQKTVPTYTGTFDQELQILYDKIVNRDKFSYNINEDALYQQYADQYQLLGQRAMMDAMGQAATMTGGYGNSYAQTVGQQAYQGYLQQLNDVVPELYGMALDQHNQEGEDLLKQYAMVGEMADTEYSRYIDELNQYWQNLQFLHDQASDAYDQGFNNWYTAQQLGYQADRDNIADEQWQKEFDFANEQWQKEYDFAIRQYEDSMKNVSYSGGGGSGKTPSTTKTETPSATAMDDFKNAIMSRSKYYASAGGRHESDTEDQYEQYVETMLDNWLDNGKLTPTQFKTLYGEMILKTKG